MFICHNKANIHTLLLYNTITCISRRNQYNMNFQFPEAKLIVIKFGVAEIIDLSLSGVPLQGWGRIQKM